MGFRLQLDEAPAEGYRRILLEQISSLLRYLAGAELDRTSAVHNARRRCKRIRALLRLIRPHHKEFCRDENGVFREISRWLSPFRDADVRVETFDELLADLAEVEDGQEPMNLAPLREVLGHPADAQAPWAFGTAVERAREAAASARERFKAVALPLSADFGLVSSGLKRSYKRGRLAMKAALADSGSAAFHEWRKRAKDLDYQLQTLRPLWPPVLKGFHKELGQLTEILGQHNDLAVLQETLEAAELPEELRRKDLRRFLEHLEARQAELRESAHMIGERLYAEKPGPFLKRMKAYWTAWKEEPVSAGH